MDEAESDRHERRCPLHGHTLIPKGGEERRGSGKTGSFHRSDVMACAGPPRHKVEPGEWDVIDKLSGAVIYRASEGGE